MNVAKGKQVTPEELLEISVNEWHTRGEDTRDEVARDILYSLVKMIERAVKMNPKYFGPTYVRNYIKLLRSIWIKFCNQTPHHDEGCTDNVEYSPDLFGSAIVALNSGDGKRFCIDHRIIFSQVCIDVFNSLVEESDDEMSNHFKTWVRK